MGTTMTGIVEWTHDSQSALDHGQAIGLPRWEDDHLHGILFQTDKEYDFFAAVAGARNRFVRTPLIPLRGVPRHLSSLARVYFDNHDAIDAGWLYLSEVERAIKHIADGTFQSGFELECGLGVLRTLVGQLNDSNVRLVFNMEP